MNLPDQLGHLALNILEEGLEEGSHEGRGELDVGCPFDLDLQFRTGLVALIMCLNQCPQLF